MLKQPLTIESEIHPSHKPTHNKIDESRERRMLIGRHSFIRQSKLSDVAGRIDYISNPKRQEYLYATY